MSTLSRERHIDYFKKTMQPVKVVSKLFLLHNQYVVYSGCQYNILKIDVEFQEQDEQMDNTHSVFELYEIKNLWKGQMTVDRSLEYDTLWKIINKSVVFAFNDSATKYEGLSKGDFKFLNELHKKLLTYDKLLKERHAND